MMEWTHVPGDGPVPDKWEAMETDVSGTGYRIFQVGPRIYTVRRSVRGMVVNRLVGERDSLDAAKALAEWSLDAAREERRVIAELDADGRGHP
jgi:hypothetical protein